MNAAQIAENLPFQPYWLPNCALWLDSAFGVYNPSGTPAAVGEKIATRIDRASGNVWTQSTDANRPTLQAAGLQYGGTCYLQTASPVVFPGDLTHFTAYYSPNELVSLGASSGSATVFPRQAGTTYFASNSATVSVATPSQLVGTSMVWMCVRRSGTACQLFGSSGASASFSALSGTFTFDCDGARPGNGNYTSSTTRIRAQVAFNRALSAGEIQRVANFLVRQYGAAA